MARSAHANANVTAMQSMYGVMKFLYAGPVLNCPGLPVPSSVEKSIALNAFCVGITDAEYAVEETFPKPAKHLALSHGTV